MLAKANTLSRASRVNRQFMPTVTRQIHAIRPIAQKRLSRLRMNWFIVGTVFGVGLSFFMNAVFAQLILPNYRSFMSFSQPELAALKDAPEENIQIMVHAANANADEAALLHALEEAANAQPGGDVAKSPIIMASLNVPDTSDYPAHTANAPQRLSLKVGAGDTLLQMLLSQNVASSEAYEVVHTLKREIDPRALKVGQEIKLTLAPHEQLEDRAAVKELAIRLPNLSTIELARLADGGFALESQQAELHEAPYRAIGTVSSSLYQAAADAGIPMKAMHQIVRAFSYDVDFQRDIHPGDKIEVLLDRKETDDGKVGGYNNLRYAALTLHGKRNEIFYYEKNGEGNWYDAKGQSVKKSLLRTPVNAARISSGFGMRRHPILGYSKMHKGVDFAASTGTPILAAGDGVVTYRGRNGGYGNYLRIRHNATYSTAYGHISRFHPTVKNGSRVKQGQVVAYVGTTGRSTGPHLHYEVLQNGRQVNPRAQRFNTATALAGKALNQFKSHIGQVRRELASLKPHGVGTQLAQADTHAR